ncbi:sigma factor-like helix-turn-helix DNA-binding protein [Alkalilimnicola ehrlichii]|uniref:sigma-70 region 4 domain-containing protein n=1 Tax=Alkalilimnicola ehrlichii TaxID=351052 RepID=UPI0011C05A4B|nr:sigma-70 region 4 domain-containing protein [Alkalilimnicola ehrlichii]
MPEPWPDHVERVEHVLAKLPEPVQEAIIQHHIFEHGIRTGAQLCGVSEHEFRRRLERGRWFLIGHFDYIDSKH